jgi:hypothetical protein
LPEAKPSESKPKANEKPKLGRADKSKAAKASEPAKAAEASKPADSAKAGELGKPALPPAKTAAPDPQRGVGTRSVGVLPSAEPPPEPVAASEVAPGKPAKSELSARRTKRAGLRTSPLRRCRPMSLGPRRIARRVRKSLMG